MIRTLILAVYGLLMIALALRSLRAQRLRERYVLLFVAIGLPFLVLAMWPDGIIFLSNSLRIEKPTLLVLIVAGFLILMLFELLSIVSVQERKISRLAQEIGILRLDHHFTDQSPVSGPHVRSGRGGERGS